MATLRSPALFNSLCCAQRQCTPNGPPLISERHASSRLASSLLRQPMQTPQGTALMALSNQGLPPGLLSLAASHQLELLAAMSPSVARSEANVEDVLYRRIADVKETQKREAVQEILFALVASQLLHATHLTLPHLRKDALSITTAKSQDAYGQNAILPWQTPHLDNLLRSIHAPEVQPLASQHVSMVINGRHHVDRPVQPNMFAKVHNFELGRMYAASVMHGYFLARMHRRFKLEQRLQVVAGPMQSSSNVTQAGEAVSMEAYIQGHGPEDESRIHHLSRLSCALTLNVIERHCEALFGRKLLQAVAETSGEANTTTSIQLGFVRTLIYQALAFGALLWDMKNNFIPLFYPHISQED